MLKINSARVFSKTKYFLFITLLINFTCLPDSFGQRVREEPPPLKERLFYGGNFGLQFGTYTDIDISPVIGIWLLPRIAVAAGPKYRFYKDPFDRTDIYGGKIYTELVVIKDFNAVIPIGINLGLFLHAENELLSLNSSFWKNSPDPSERFLLNTILTGAGISQPIGRRASLNMMVLWALSESSYGVYSNPEIRVSFSF